MKKVLWWVRNIVRKHKTDKNLKNILLVNCLLGTGDSFIVHCFLGDNKEIITDYNSESSYVVMQNKRFAVLYML